MYCLKIDRYQTVHNAHKFILFLRLIMNKLLYFKNNPESE